jgi:hypothetical protein
MQQGYISGEHVLQYQSQYQYFDTHETDKYLPNPALNYYFFKHFPNSNAALLRMTGQSKQAHTSPPGWRVCVERKPLFVVGLSHN